MNNIRLFSSFSLRVIAIIAMLLDHMWLTILPTYTWMTYVGRIAFPIFSFLLVEGFFHTSNLKKYFIRLVIFALISEIPFNLLMNDGIIYPYHQNVLFTFVIGLATIYIIEQTKSINNKLASVVLVVLTCIFSSVFATLVLSDYFGYGILIILTFYFSYGLEYGWIMQLVGMIYVNYILIGGLCIPLFGGNLEFPIQAFALFSLIFIWLYNGKVGINSKILQYIFYIFYPLHMLILYFISTMLN